MLVITTALTFARTLGNGFINYDDPIYISENPYVAEGLTPRTLHWALRDTQGNYWHPVSSLTHVAVGELFGADPAAHHGFDVALHALSAGLAFAVLNALTGAAWRSAAAAALFAVHPLRVESVAWATETSTPCVFLTLLAMIAYVAYVSGRGRRAGTAYAAVVLFTALALLTKPIPVTLPFVLLLLDFWPLDRFGLWRAQDGSAEPPPAAGRTLARLLLEKAPLFALVALMTLGAMMTKADAGALDAAGADSLPARLGIAVVSYARYLRATVWPLGLSVAYPPPPVPPLWQVVGACVLIVGLTAAAVWQWRRRPYLAVGWLWFLGTLVPFIGVLRVREGTWADRYTYFPSIGLAVAVAWGVAELAGRARAQAAAVRVVVIVLVVLAVRTYAQLGYWQDSSTLFAHALDVTRDNALAHVQLANELARAENLRGAEDHYRAALRIRPAHARTYLNLGNVLARRGSWSEAEASLREAIHLDPRMARAHLSLGLVLLRQQRSSDAEASLRAAIKAEPALAAAHYQLGVALRDQGRFAEAGEAFAAALRLQPSLQDARRALEDVRGRGGATRPSTSPATTLSDAPRPL
jgi:cytochrome c-type biogenesis protein CcmH/NrfG